MSEQTQRQADEFELINDSRTFYDLVSSRLLPLIEELEYEEDVVEARADADALFSELRGMYDDRCDALRAVRAERDRLREVVKAARMFSDGVTCLDTHCVNKVCLLNRALAGVNE